MLNFYNITVNIWIFQIKFVSLHHQIFNLNQFQYGKEIFNRPQGW